MIVTNKQVISKLAAMMADSMKDVFGEMNAFQKSL